VEQEDSRKLSVMLKLILQLSHVGNDTLAFVGLLVIIHTNDRTVQVINGTSLCPSYIISN
jgi:hypothetical protein